MKKQEILKIKNLRKMYIKQKIIIFIYSIFAILVLYNIIFNFNKTLTGEEYLSIYGIFFLNTDAINSVENEIKENDLLIAKKIDIQDIEKDDIVIWKKGNVIKFNKVTNIRYDSIEGKKQIIVNYNENILSNEKTVIGKKIKIIPYLGILLNVIQGKVFSIIAFLFILIYLLYIIIGIKERDKRTKIMSQINEKKEQISK